MIVRVEAHPLGRRLFVGRRRVHHYHSGIALIAYGAWLIWADRADLRRTPDATSMRHVAGERHRVSHLLPPFDPVIGVTTSHDTW